MVVVAERMSGLKAPFPWFGGKRRCAHIVWPRFGNVPNYVEPFAGSLAVLLARPEIWPAKNETVNDLDCYLANFWRASLHAPEEVARCADWPVNEADLHARHQWLHDQAGFRERMHSDPDYYDAKVAGWWVWGISAWIGDCWCRVGPQSARPHLHREKGVQAIANGKRPLLKQGGAGVHAGRSQGKNGKWRARPNLTRGNMGVHRKRPDIRKGGRGVNRQMPDISGNDGASGRGVHAKYVAGTHRKLPDVSGHHGCSGRGIHAGYCEAIVEYFCALAHRLRRVRVCCGDWMRVLGPSPTIHIGVTAVFLDPPYGDAGRDVVYNHDSRDIASDVRAWCIDNEDEPKVRIALCGYEGEHDELEARGWQVVPWKAGGGYGARNRKNRNSHRERIWFSPHCLRPEEGQARLFEEA